MTRRRREDTDIDQFLYPKLMELGIARTHIRRNIATSASGRQRGDLWISELPDSHPRFEQRIVALIECKDRYAAIGDLDWHDAVRQGQQKALNQDLRAFFVTNTGNQTRCYNAVDLTEIHLDGQVITDLQPLPILRAIQTQVNESASNVYYASFTTNNPDPKQFRTSLWNIRQTFRAHGVSKGSEDSMIKTSLTFCILKLISEQQQIRGTIPETIFLWNDWRPGQMDRDIRNSINDLTALRQYQHLRGSLDIDQNLNAEACVTIHRELSKYRLYASDFDFFGLIYESFANTQMKKDFGEFYTPRHVIRTMIRLRLADEMQPRPLAICDPACGTGGFLVEAFLYLQRNYRQTNTLNDAVLSGLKENTFHGFDTNAEVAIPFARTNMMMADDGGANIRQTRDSLIELPSNAYDYILANVPYGDYDGQAAITTFSYSSRRRYELLFVEKIVQSLKPGGKAAVIVPDALVEATSYSQFRMRLLYDVTMEAVISLPNFVFEPYTSEKTYVLMFTKRRPSQIGVLQTEPIWHFIVDDDGFQQGKKRYAITDNDLPVLEAGYRSLVEEGKAGFVDMQQVNPETFYSLCSEYYLRLEMPIEVSLNKFSQILEELEGLLNT